MPRSITHMRLALPYVFSPGDHEGAWPEQGLGMLARYSCGCKMHGIHLAPKLPPRSAHCMRLSRLWSTIPVFLSMCFSFGSFLPAYAQQPPQRQGSDANQRGSGNRPEGSGPTCAASNNSMPSGLVVVIMDKPQLPTLDLRVLRNPCISG